MRFRVVPFTQHTRGRPSAHHGSVPWESCKDGSQNDGVCSHPSDPAGGATIPPFSAVAPRRPRPVYLQTARQLSFSLMHFVKQSVFDCLQLLLHAA